MKKSKTQQLLDHWLGYKFSTGSYPGEDYVKFQREAKQALKELTSEAGYSLYSFNANHYCFSAVVQENKSGAFAYISISDVRFWPDEWAHKVLYRQMKHEKDWTGGANHYCRLTELPDMLQRLYR